MLERRAQPRRKMILPVKISTAKAPGQLVAYTVDITNKGAKICGVQQVLEVGSTIKLIRGAHRAEFRVVWVNQVDPKQIQLGVEAVHADDSFWGVNLKKEDAAERKDMDVLLQLLKGKTHQ